MKILIRFNLILTIIILLLIVSRNDALSFFTYFPIFLITIPLQLIIGIVKSIKNRSINSLLVSGVLFLLIIFFVLASLPLGFGRQ